MDYTITINIDNEAFENEGEEIARILNKLAIACQSYGGGVDTKLKDINGNTVGESKRE